MAEEVLLHGRRRCYRIGDRPGMGALAGAPAAAGLNPGLGPALQIVTTAAASGLWSPTGTMSAFTPSRSTSSGCPSGTLLTPGASRMPWLR
ncbi:hypothetical protein CBM2609_A130020 [Cupriavidus taiwanensis]|nr:hypothetical protein CBM2604_A110020 [Cupriavidus taiwanensis]SOZ24610.1 hypothetical protein CBM2609_A130020 [Cupriavidus taiwanensis]SOZ44512.1 hypothetical protein CBM2610_A140020 [Cupriavidus taiwanensis]